MWHTFIARNYQSFCFVLCLSLVYYIIRARNRSPLSVFWSKVSYVMVKCWTALDPPVTPSWVFGQTGIRSRPHLRTITSFRKLRYTGIVNYFCRVCSEQGATTFLQGNFKDRIRLPTPALKLSVKASFNSCSWLQTAANLGMFFTVYLRLVVLLHLGPTFVYPLDYANAPCFKSWFKYKTFDGLFVCLKDNCWPQGFFLSPRWSSTCTPVESARTVAPSLVPSTPSRESTRKVRHRYIYFASHLRQQRQPIIWALLPLMNVVLWQLVSTTTCQKVCSNFCVKRREKKNEANCWSCCKQPVDSHSIRAWLARAPSSVPISCDTCAPHQGASAFRPPDVLERLALAEYASLLATIALSWVTVAHTSLLKSNVLPSKSLVPGWSAGLWHIVCHYDEWRWNTGALQLQLGAFWLQVSCTNPVGSAPCIIFSTSAWYETTISRTWVTSTSLCHFLQFVLAKSYLCAAPFGFLLRQRCALAFLFSGCSEKCSLRCCLLHLGQFLSWVTGHGSKGCLRSALLSLNFSRTSPLHSWTNGWATQKTSPSTKKKRFGQKKHHLITKNSFVIETNQTPLKKKKLLFFFWKKIKKKTLKKKTLNFFFQKKFFEQNKNLWKKSLKHKNIKTFKIQTNPLAKKKRKKQKNFSKKKKKTWKKNLWKRNLLNDQKKKPSIKTKKRQFFFEKKKALEKKLKKKNSETEKKTLWKKSPQKKNSRKNTRKTTVFSKKQFNKQKQFFQKTLEPFLWVRTTWKKLGKKTQTIRKNWIGKAVKKRNFWKKEKHLKKKKKLFQKKIVKKNLWKKNL